MSIIRVACLEYYASVYSIRGTGVDGAEAADANIGKTRCAALWAGLSHRWGRRVYSTETGKKQRVPRIHHINVRLKKG